MYSTQIELNKQHGQIVLVFYQIMMITGTMMGSYPIWPLSIPTKYKQTFARLWWYPAIFYMLILFSGFFVIVSNFGQLQFVIFTMNCVLAVLLVGWKIALIMSTVGTIIVFNFYKYYASIDTIDIAVGSPMFIFMYSLVLISSLIAIFFKPKQEEQEHNVEMIAHQHYKISDQRLEIDKATDLKHEFLRNLQHESRTPIANISSMVKMLYENYNKFTDSQRRDAIHEVVKNSVRIESMVNNLIDLSQLKFSHYKIKTEKIDFSFLVRDRIIKCKKLYIGNKNTESREFILKIDDNIMMDCDEYYMSQTLDNMIINAIQYCPKGKITISLTKQRKNIILTIRDEGIGIPIEESYDVFSAFTTSSKTKSKAGGRGIGLTLCKHVVELYNGTISVKPNTTKGVTFTVSLPS